MNLTMFKIVIERIVEEVLSDTKLIAKVEEDIRRQTIQNQKDRDIIFM